jgi:hypothetical protein
VVILNNSTRAASKVWKGHPPAVLYLILTSSCNLVLTRFEVVESLFKLSVQALACGTLQNANAERRGVRFAKTIQQGEAAARPALASSSDAAKFFAENKRRASIARFMARQMVLAHALPFHLSSCD